MFPDIKYEMLQPGGRRSPLVKAISLQALLFGEIASVLISCSFSGEGLLC